MERAYYRPDIDGLRAIAVLAVVLYHLGFDGFSGGFVGVDIFFVISGFLITGIIKRKQEEGGFRILDFFARRVRRLFPALFATVAVSFAVAFFILPPPDMQRFSGSAVSALFSFSNIFFWSGTGYFDTESITKPLLHTWSLSVEEQFYLLWPFFIIICVRLGRVLGGLALLFSAVISLVFAQAMVDNHQPTTFFWMPFRIYEFVIGGFLAWFSIKDTKGGRISNLTFCLGLVMIAYSVFIFSEETTFPGLSALLPCFGAALVIYSGEESFFGRVVRNKVLVGIGLISYSFYLVHWPVISFAYFMGVELGGSLVKLAMLAASILLGYLSYRYVEIPFRFGAFSALNPRYKLATYTAALALVSLPAASAWSSQGWVWRISEDIRLAVEQAHVWNSNRHSYFRDRDCFVSGRSNDYMEAFDFETCQNSTKERSVLLLGDSQAAYSWWGLQHNLEEYDVLMNTVTGCRPLIGYGTNNCGIRNEYIFGEGHLPDVDAVILQSHWNPVHVEMLPETIEFFSRQGVPVYVIGPGPRFPSDLPSLLSRYSSIEDAIPDLNAMIDSSGVKDIDSALKKMSESMGFKYFSILDVLCDEGDGKCSIAVGDSGNIVTYDRWHLSDKSSEYIFRGFSLEG